MPGRYPFLDHIAVVGDGGSHLLIPDSETFYAHGRGSSNGTVERNRWSNEVGLVTFIRKY